VVTGRRLPRRTWVAIAVAGLGMAWMFAGQLGDAGDASAWLGSIVALGVPVAAAVNWTASQQGQSRGTPVDWCPPCCWRRAVGAGGGALGLASGRVGARSGWLAALGVGQLAIPCVLAVLCARVLPAAEVSLLGLLEIVFGIGLVWAIAGEAPRPEVLQGGALVIGALLANELMARACQRYEDRVVSPRGWMQGACAKQGWSLQARATPQTAPWRDNLKGSDSPPSALRFLCVPTHARRRAP
jgi:drug/metabolite transporter (DMT)-like permease